MSMKIDSIVISIGSLSRFPALSWYVLTISIYRHALFDNYQDLLKSRFVTDVNGERILSLPLRP